MLEGHIFYCCLLFRELLPEAEDPAPQAHSGGVTDLLPSAGFSGEEKAANKLLVLMVLRV